MALLVTGAVFSGLFDAILSGNYQLAEVFSSILSVLTSLILVGVTWWYVGLTSDLVSLTEKQRQQERELEISRHQTQQQNLRQAFLIELNEVEGTLNKLVESKEKDQLTPNRYPEILMPTVVYESNANQIGILTTNEAASLTSIYTRLLHLHSLMKSYNEIKEKDKLTKREQAEIEVVETVGPYMASEILEEIGELAEIMAAEAEHTMTIDRLSENFGTKPDHQPYQ
ncbi:hypothetical protein EL22_25575 [Halostagnicola sp. A56]|nr:hypothetical protein EL22_25575 [Halostagnicola sp. A56]